MFPFCRQHGKKKTCIILTIKKILGSNKNHKISHKLEHFYWLVFAEKFSVLVFRAASCEYMWDFHINGFLLSPDIYLFIPQPRDEAPFIYL